LLALIENSKKAVKILEEQERKNVNFLIVGILSGLVLGVIGNLTVTVFTEISKVYFPVEPNLLWWTIGLVITILATSLVGGYLYRTSFWR